jgi:hypothetical protein
MGTVIKFWICLLLFQSTNIFSQDIFSQAIDIPPKILILNTYSSDVHTVRTLRDFFGYWLSSINDNLSPKNLFLNAPISKSFMNGGKCVSALGYLRFYVDKDGKIDKDDIAFQGEFNQFAKDLMVEILTYSSPFWKPRMVDGKAFKSKPFFLPMYSHDAGCTGNEKKGDKGFRDFLRHIEKITKTPEGFYEMPGEYLLEPFIYSVER